MAKGISENIEAFLTGRTQTKEERQRLLVFILGIVAGILGYPLHILGLWGSSNNILQAISIVTEAFLVIDFILYYKRVISLFTAFASYGFVMLLLQSAKILYIAHLAPGGARI